MRSFLMISPNFPPMGAVGAKRALHFARHLPGLGWRPAVVALPAPMDRDPALDRLVPDVPLWRGYRSGPLAWIEDWRGRGPTAMPHRERPPDTAALEQDGVLRTLGTVADRYTHYLPWAWAGAWWFCRRQRCELIYVNAGPHSGQMLGWWLASLTGLPLVLDLRDPWSIEPYYRAARTPRANRWVDQLEHRFFTKAKRVILNTETACAAYRAHYEGRIPPERFTTIRNAFDPDLYDPLPEPPGSAGAFEVMYFGHMRPAKNALLFLEGYRRFIDTERLAPGQAMLTTLGTRTPPDEEAIARLGLTGFTRTHPWVPFTECRALLGRADLLLDLMGPGHELQISGKFYDYLASARPIFSVTPSDETARILAETGAGTRVSLDSGAIAAALGRALRDKNGGRRFTPNHEALRQFEAGPAAARLAAVFEGAGR